MKKVAAVEGQIMVECSCGYCGVPLAMPMEPEFHAAFIEFNGYILCTKCTYESSDTSEKSKKLIELGHEILQIVIEKPSQKNKFSPPPDYQSYLNTDWWRKQRDAALERAHYRCQLCNSPDDLNVHHRTYKRIGCEIPEDLTVLCRGCHYWFHHSKRGTIEE